MNDAATGFKKQHFDDNMRRAVTSLQLGRTCRAETMHEQSAQMPQDTCLSYWMFYIDESLTSFLNNITLSSFSAIPPNRLSGHHFPISSPL